MSLSSWGYYKVITVETDDLIRVGLNHYVLRLILYYGSGIDNPTLGKIYLNGRCRSDFGDIRFTEYPNVASKLDYWIERYESGNYAIVWVRIKNITSSTKDIAIFYGNQNATREDNPSGVFYLFDHFDVDTGRWGGNYSISDSKIILSVTNAGGSIYLKDPLNLSFNRIAIEGIVGIDSYPYNASFELCMIYDVNNNFYARTGAVAWNDHRWIISTLQGNVIDGTIGTGSYRFRFALTRYIQKLRLGESDVLTSDFIFDLPSTIKLTLLSGGVSLYTLTYWVDFIAIRPYVDPEPSILSISNEMINTFTSISFSDGALYGFFDNYSLTTLMPIQFNDVGLYGLLDNYSLTTLIPIEFSDRGLYGLSDSYSLTRVIPIEFSDRGLYGITDSYNVSKVIIQPSKAPISPILIILIIIILLIILYSLRK